MTLWTTETVRTSMLEQTLNRLSLDGWEVFSVLRGAPSDTGSPQVIVVAHRSASRREVEEAVETGPGWVEEARDLLQQGRKIQAIKLVRAATGWGLKESKEYVERDL
ncbi:MAG: ribosomal protein L7/L12 [Alphaproteobacteria bacterium]|nr:ribosomal protein L7/L12 [Alphaproteobacteria bacterium]